MEGDNRMKPTVYFNKVLHLEFKDHKDMMLAFARVSEYHESPKEGVKWRAIGWAEWLMSYMATDGSVPFFTEWEGFNVPVNVIQRWNSELTSLDGIMTEQEFEMLSQLGTCRLPIEYVLATVKGDEETLLHELAHSLYTVQPEYRTEVLLVMQETWGESMLRGDVFKSLIRAGYDSAISHLLDEWQAYMVAGGDEVFNRRLFEALGLEDEGGKVNPVRVVFDRYMKGATE